MYYRIVIISLLSMISSIAVVAQNCEKYADYFGSSTVPSSFGINSGTLNWAGDWTEIGENDGYDVGDIKVNGNLVIQGDTYGAQREADLSTCMSAQLHIRAYNANTWGNPGDKLYYLISADGVTFDTIGSHTYTGVNGPASVTELYIILPSSYYTSNFTLKLSSSGTAQHVLSGVYIDCCSDCDSYARDESSLGAADGAISLHMHGTPLYSIDGGATWQAANTFESLAAGTYDVLIKQANFAEIYGPCAVEVSSILVGSTLCPKATTRGVQMIINN